MFLFFPPITLLPLLYPRPFTPRIHFPSSPSTFPDHSRPVNIKLADVNGVVDTYGGECVEKEERKEMLVMVEMWMELPLFQQRSRKTSVAQTPARLKQWTVRRRKDTWGEGMLWMRFCIVPRPRSMR